MYVAALIVVSFVSVYHFYAEARDNREIAILKEKVKARVKR